MSIDVEVLVQDHKQMLDTIDGLEIHTEPGLIAQLREAVFGGMETTGGSQLGSRMPISAGALDLYRDLDKEITEAWDDAFHTVPGAGRIESLLTQWAAWAQDDTYVPSAKSYAAQLVQDWMRRIKEFFDPPRSAEIQAACINPACGARYVYRTQDGRTTRSAALRFERDRKTGRTLNAYCANCGIVWEPDKFEFLANAIGIDVAQRREAFAKQQS